jgi:cobalt transporter subunit CbtA
VFCLAPTLGLPPELPGTAAADLGQRQTWWIGTAAATAAAWHCWCSPALAAEGARRSAAVVPHVIGAPQPAVHESLAPEALETQFKIASWLTNAAFWVALGLLSAWLYRRSSQA